MSKINVGSLIIIWGYVILGALITCETKTDIYQMFLIGIGLTACWAAAEGISQICDKAVEKYAKKEYYIKW